MYACKMLIVYIAGNVQTMRPVQFTQVSYSVHLLQVLFQQTILVDLFRDTVKFQMIIFQLYPVAENDNSSYWY